jgi:hypothetical protein
VKGTHNKFRPIKDGPDFIEHVEDVLIVRIEEPLFFANTGKKACSELDAVEKGRMLRGISFF